MTRSRLLISIGAALAFGLLMAFVPQGNRRLSLDVWLVVTAGWLAISIATEALSTAPIHRLRLRSPLRFEMERPVRPTWRWPFLTRPSPPPVLAPRDLLALEGTLLSAVENPRAYAHRLRPRLRAVAEHRLRADRAIDRTARPDRAAAALGDSAWLIDDGPVERPPTPPELARFFDRLATLAPDPAAGATDHEGNR